MQVDLGQLFSVALLALLGALIARRLPIFKRLSPLMPIILATVIFWGFGNSPTLMGLICQGVASGLLAGGLMYLWYGLSGQLL